MRIGVVLENLNDTGANRVSVDRAVRWQRRGDEVTVFVSLRSEYAEKPVTLPPGLAVVFGSRGGRIRSTLPRALVALTRLARECDVLVAGTEVGFGLLLARGATRLARRPLAVTVQSRIDVAVDTYVDARLRPPTRAVLVGVDLAVCVARTLVASTVAFGVPAHRVVAVRNAVSRDELRAAAREQPAVAWDDDVPLVVGVGRLVRQKGFDLLIRAHAKALADGAPAHQLMILGGGEEERGPLEALARDLGVAGSVRLPGFLPNTHAVVSRAALFVSSSRWEGFSLCLAEALACGTPCMAFDCVAGPAEVLDDGRFGRLLPAEDVDALATALREHLLDPEALTRLVDGSDGLDIFDPARAADEHRHALAQLVGGGFVSVGAV